MRELQRHDAFGLEQDLDAGDEVVEVGNLRQDVVADDQVGLAALARELSSPALTPKNSVRVGTPLAMAACATFTAGSMPSTGTPSGRKCCSRYPSLLASSTTKLSGAEAKPLADHHAIGARMLDPRRRVG